MNYKKWLIEDLQNLQRDRFAILQAQEELATLEAEFTAIKATNFDKMPTGSGDNVQEEKLLTVLAKKEERKTNLTATEKHVRDIERLLDQLPENERKVIDLAVIDRNRYADFELEQLLGYERTQIWRLKNKALNHLARLRFGASFQP